MTITERFPLPISLIDAHGNALIFTETLIANLGIAKPDWPAAVTESFPLSIQEEIESLRQEGVHSEQKNFSRYIHFQDKTFLLCLAFADAQRSSFYVSLHPITLPSTDKKILSHLASLEKAQKMSSIGHWEFDHRENSLFWSDQVYRIFGLKRQQFAATYEAFLEYVHENDRVLVDKAYTDSIKNRFSCNIEHRIVNAQGELRYVKEYCEHTFDEDGNVLRSIGTVLDISDFVEAQRKLLIANKVFESVTSSILITDENQVILQVNEGFTRMTQYLPSEVIGKTPRMLQSGWQSSDFYADMWSSISEKGFWRSEIWDRKKDGTIYACDLSINAIKNEKGVITQYLAISSDITEQKNQEKRIHEMAFYDFLTGLPNRTLFQERIEQRIVAAKYLPNSFAVFFIDLDNFKYMNDSLGHKTGDEYLKIIGQKLRHRLSESDMIARVGGDEFLICLESVATEAEAVLLALRIIETTAEPVLIANHALVTGASIGITLYPKDGETSEQLIRGADSAMFYAKKSGKNNYQFFSSEMHDKARVRLEYESRLRNAIRNGELYVAYQPKINIQNNKIEGMEALLRWNNPVLGNVPPMLFIGIAEETGAIIEIGQWVLQKAVSDTAILHRNHPELVVSVNVSVNELLTKDYLPRIKNLLKSTGYPPEKLEIEITETLIMENMNTIVPKLQELRNLGVKISIDDFGTGYSSMSKLKSLPINTLKIDREFIRDIENNQEDRAITAAIVRLAESLDMCCIAEGAENSEQIAILKEAKCSSVQGFFYSKPLPYEEFRAYIENLKSNG